MHYVYRAAEIQNGDKVLSAFNITQPQETCYDCVTILAPLHGAGPCSSLPLFIM